MKRAQWNIAEEYTNVGCCRGKVDNQRCTVMLKVLHEAQKGTMHRWLQMVTWREAGALGTEVIQSQ
jgi:hypothetical protein